MVVFNFLAVIVIFPAMIAIDRNRRSRGSDLFCCCRRCILLVHLNSSDAKLPLSDDASYEQLYLGKKMLSDFSEVTISVFSITIH